jgi:glycosyltransferase involved in cell wall biosynthesis
VHELAIMPDADLAGLYAGAEFLFFASLYEGFGFPLLEAMACACPVVASRGTVLEELAGDAAVLVDPTDIEAMTATVKALVNDDGLRSRLRAAGPRRAADFDWDQTVAATAAAWRSMI